MGVKLWQGTLDLYLTLVTDKAFPTKIGTSTCSDSAPDLTFIKNVVDPMWTNSATALGSDHYLLITRFPVYPNSIKEKEFTWTDWDLFRRGHSSSSICPELDAWVEQMKKDASS